MSIFNKSHFNSSDGMLTSVWGPSLWHSLHTISFNYPVKPSNEDKENYYIFIKSLGNVLPCKFCRENYIKNLKNLKFSKKIFKNRNTFSKFIYDLHEDINCMLGKISGLTYEQVKNRYEHFRSRCLNNQKEKIKNGIVLEKGCIEPLYGEKSKCVLKIVPTKSKMESFKMSSKCKIYKF